MRRGNCCEDFEQECLDEIGKEDCKLCRNCFDKKCNICRSNADLKDGICTCKVGFTYNVEEDICVNNDRSKPSVNEEADDDKEEYTNPSNNDATNVGNLPSIHNNKRVGSDIKSLSGIGAGKPGLKYRKSGKTGQVNVDGIVEADDVDEVNGSDKSKIVT